MNYAATGRKQQSMRKGPCGENGGAHAVCPAAAMRKLIKPGHNASRPRSAWHPGEAMYEGKSAADFR